ncbi:MAG TPA: SBBP repeat-containing protein, partial [Nitrospirota bacterium]
DLFLAKFGGTDGGLLWVKQMGSTGSDLIYGCGVDGAGNVYAGGYTWGDFDGYTSAGMSDIIVVKFDPDGNRLWSVQRGNEYDSWVNNMDVDAAGDVYIGGDTWGGLDGNISQSGHYDAFLMKLDLAGTWQWTKQFGDGFWTTVNTIAHDGPGNVFVTGFTGGSIVDGYTNKGSNDYFVTAFGPDGTELWRREGGTSQSESPTGICADGYGNVYLSGGSAGRLGADTVTGSADAYIIKYRNDGTMLWTRQFGTPEADYGNAVVTDASGGLFLCGETHAGIDGNTYSGGTDPFVMKLDIAQPFSVVTWPSDGAALNTPSCTITGYSDDITGTGVSLVEVSTDGGATWQQATGASVWSHDWTILAPGTYTIMSRATDSLGNVETPGQGITVTVGNNTIGSDITSPLDGSSYTTSPVTVAGTATGGGITQVEVSTDGGATWAAATDNSGNGSWSAWNYSWAAPADGTYTVASRAVSGTDHEYPYGSIIVSVDWVTPSTTAKPSAGNYQSRQRVILTASEPSDIRCTTDGTEPDMSSPVNSLPLLLSSGTVLKYFATDPAGHSEAVNTSSYTVNPAALWTRQEGSLSSDYACGAAADGTGNVYVTGYTDGQLGGDTVHGGSDVFVSKYDASGNNLWTHMYGSYDNETGQGAAVDTLGNVYVAGYTYGPFEGGTVIGGSDAFAMKLDPEGNVIWSRQFGTAYYEYGRGVAVDASGSVYVVGETTGGMGAANAGNRDLFVVKFDPAGNALWQSQDGTSGSDYCRGVAIGADGYAYVTGDTSGSLDGLTNSGNSDLFLKKYNPDGTTAWTKLTGSASADFGMAVSVDVSGAVYVAGVTYGALHGNTNNGGVDGYLMKFGPDGTRLWTRQAGTTLADYVYAVTAGDAATVSV